MRAFSPVLWNWLRGGGGDRSAGCVGPDLQLHQLWECGAGDARERSGRPLRYTFSLRSPSRSRCAQVRAYRGYWWGVSTRADNFVSRAASATDKRTGKTLMWRGIQSAEHAVKIANKDAKKGLVSSS